MDIFKARNWGLGDIKKLIENNVLEEKRLEYKACPALQNLYKDEISKDVSSFANSDGGVIVYGIKELEEDRTIRLKLDEGFDLNGPVNKEWLENVIYSKINPKIEELYINPIEITPGKVIYVVVIPKGTTAYMAGNFRYYKRRNFKSEPMEDYEVRDVMNRQSRPKLQLRLTVPRIIPLDSLYYFRVVVRNISEVMVQYFAVKILIPEAVIEGRNFKGGRRTMINGTSYREYIRQGDLKQFIFPGFHVFLNNKFLPPISPRKSQKMEGTLIYWTVYSDYNSPQSGYVPLGKIIGERIEKKQGNK